ncbi:flagellar biosynthetic protein FliO [Aquidulcibacter sp.]|uniref:flagellar biosynthetic protein FliO n=1 Tax=Aquidulcibacter sp. TaxID=2052990 RepID=UPI0025C4ACD6|nr:flagellar biosynthetic protein FliO [Aquidulcibacter sp.]MCA3694777.1 flagellar biosynthetic protein FliO [Aquidulcibacter sp.]
MELFLDMVRALAALSVTLGLLLGAAWLARRYGLMQGQMPSLTKGRLKLVEQLWLDAGRTRAILIRCDDQEHLVLVSPTGASTISSKPIHPETDYPAPSAAPSASGQVS